MTPSTDLAVRRSITVEAGIDRAWQVFTDGFDRWWPRTHHLVQGVEMKTAVLETKPDGRWYELNEDGSTCDWGKVLAWEPPHRLLLSWQISSDFQPIADAAEASEVEVTFTAAEPGRTRVDLVHRGFERTDAPERGRDSVAGEGGWTAILELFGGAVAA